MVAFTPLALAAALATTASAHFGLEYPVRRSPTLGKGHNYSQWTYPCAGVPADLPNGNRTDWPLKGGSVVLDLHHDWTYIFINLGLGANVTNFNYTLTPEFWNSTGSGTLCVPTLPLPADLNVTDGTQASIQVVTVGAEGSGLYNCADITFRDSAKALEGDACMTSEGLTYAPVKAAAASGNGTTNDPPKGSAGSVVSGNPVAISLVAGLAVLFTCGIAL